MYKVKKMQETKMRMTLCNIVRHSKLTRTVEMKFVGDDLNVMTDLKMNKKRTKGSK